MKTYEERDNKIKEIADKEFLDKLIEVAKLTGWSNDYYEVSAFVGEVYTIATGAMFPITDPYDVGDDIG